VQDRLEALARESARETCWIAEVDLEHGDGEPLQKGAVPAREVVEESDSVPRAGERPHGVGAHVARSARDQDPHVLSSGENSMRTRPEALSGVERA
jgi:hypothetical protein